MDEQINRLIPVTQWSKYHSWPPVGGLRHLIYEREENGFEKVLKRPNRVWLIDERAFFRWTEERKFKFRANTRNKL